MKQLFRLVHQEARNRAAEACLTSPDGYIVRISEPTRSLEQNSLLWSALSEVSDQVVWHGRKLTPTEWKFVFSAALKKQEVVVGLDGGFVVLGQSTSKMTKGEMSDLIELIYSFGIDHGAKFSEV